MNKITAKAKQKCNHPNNKFSKMNLHYRSMTLILWQKFMS